MTFADTQRHYYADKTLFIRDMIERNWEVSVITCPRGFGKSFNMDMLKAFFEISDEDTSKYFRDKKIWACGEGCLAEQGKYPVIYIALGSVDEDSWAEAYEAVKSVIAKEFSRHKELAASENLTKADIGTYKRIVNHTGGWADCRSSLKSLSNMLSKHYKKKPIILIDDYDTPIQSAYDKGYYDDIVDFMKGFLLDGLKYNPYFEFGVLTGVLPVSGQSLSGSLNSFDYYPVLESRYAEYFGFTREEVRDMLAYYGAGNKYREVCKRYGGYMFGGTEIFNPWSVSNCVKKGFAPGIYWVNAGMNPGLDRLLKNVTSEVAARISELAAGGTITARVDKTVSYPYLMEDSENVFTLLLHSGYLTSTGENTKYPGMYDSKGRWKTAERYYYLRVPNEEVAGVFRKEVYDRMTVSGK